MIKLKVALRKRIENGENLQDISVELINNMINDFGISGEMAKEILFSIYKEL